MNKPRTTYSHIQVYWYMNSALVSQILTLNKDCETTHVCHCLAHRLKDITGQLQLFSCEDPNYSNLRWRKIAVVLDNNLNYEHVLFRH